MIRIGHPILIGLGAFFPFLRVVYCLFRWYKLCTIFRSEIVMLHPAYIIKDIKTILELSDSARHTLLFILDSFNGEQVGKLDRSGLNAAEKQKLKRGIAELKAKLIIIKSSSQQSVFVLNSLFIKTTQVTPREARYINSGMYKEGHGSLLSILTAIEHFFEEFHSKQFVIKYKIYKNKPRYPYIVFWATLMEARYNLVENPRYVQDNLLLSLIHISREIKFHCDAQETIFGLNTEQAEKIIERFNTTVFKNTYLIEFCKDHETKALYRFMERWFMENYPELSI